MKHNLTWMAAALLAWAGCVRGRPADSVVFADDLTRGPAREWKWIGGNWGLKEECLEQNGSGPADPKKAILILGKPEEVSTDVVVTAKVRIDSLAAGSDSRVGLTVCSDPETGCGYNLVFHQGKLQFMRDFVAWSPGIAFPYETGQWGPAEAPQGDGCRCKGRLGARASRSRPNG